MLVRDHNKTESPQLMPQHFFDMLPNPMEATTSNLPSIPDSAPVDSTESSRPFQEILERLEHIEQEMKDLKSYQGALLENHVTTLQSQLSTLKSIESAYKQVTETVRGLRKDLSKDRSEFRTKLAQENKSSQRHIRYISKDICDQQAQKIHKQNQMIGEMKGELQSFKTAMIINQRQMFRKLGLLDEHSDDDHADTDTDGSSDEDENSPLTRSPGGSGRYRNGIGLCGMGL